MKTLYLLRHAHTQPGHAQGDQYRMLSGQGEAEAKALGLFMKDKGYKPDYVLCSPAVRTRQTWEGVSESLDVTSVIYPDALYNASYETLVSAIKHAPESAKSLLVIAHNPGMHQSAFTLSHPDSGPMLDELSMRYLPGTLTVLECPVEWDGIMPGRNTLKAVYPPSRYMRSI